MSPARHTDGAREKTSDDSGARQENGARRDYRPEGAAAGVGTFATLKRTATEFMEDNLTDWAAALTYYGLLALFPALIAMVSLIGLVGDPKSTTSSLTEIITSIGPSSAAETFSGPIESLASNQSAAGFAFVIGLLVALWSASGYVGAFMRASNVIYETPEGRPFWKLRPLQLVVTLGMIVLMALLALGLVLTGPIVDAVAGPIGLGDTAVSVWNIAKWPVMVAIFIVMVDLLYYASPNVKLRGFKWVTAGSLVAIVVWAIASAAFAFYVANFSSYDKTYGTLGGLVALLVWFWISNLAILFGHQLNAERERSLEIEEGRPRAEREIQLEPRSEPKDQKTT
ncbi:MAG TPA: YihY/virulence factor BrkB family protein [Solirubrobacterales bacterium]|jgi:membrane protein|nr:YihY/virulence factor BrkB family protein [Solirubrobacterales bacterium]